MTTTASSPGIGAFSSILARQCRTAPAEAAAIVRHDGADRIDILAAHPDLPNSPSEGKWIVEAARNLPPQNGERRTRVVQGSRPGEPSFACVPIGAGANVWALYLLTHAPADPSLVAERLTLSAAALHLLDSHGEAHRREGETDLLRRAMGTLTAMASYDRFNAAAMALCNHVAAEWKCDRVSLGFLHGPYVRVEAMSHTEKFVARSSLVQSLEAVMEECLDQDQEIVVPSDDDSTVIRRAAMEFDSRHGPMALASIPIRRSGAPVGVLTLERPADAPFPISEIAALRLMVDAASAHLDLVRRYRRWFGASIASSARTLIESALGPRYAWAKLTAVALAAAAIFFAVVPGTYRVRADARVEAIDRRVVAGPFDGFLLESLARTGDIVNAGDVLARLDASDLVLRLGSLRAEQDGAVREAALAQRERKDAEAQIARARAKRAEADIGLIERRIEQATIRAPAAGVVVSGDLERVVGAPVSTGDTLFEVASLDSLRVEVFVAEDQIADIAAGSKGTLATLSRPDAKMPIEITRIDPVAEVRAGRNVFRALASISERPEWLRPGMEGTVRIDAGRRSYPSIWTRRTVNWLRMKLWI
jgi:RND family efflux transporter MFP subunit